MCVYKHLYINSKIEMSVSMKSDFLSYAFIISLIAEQIIFNDEH